MDNRPAKKRIALVVGARPNFMKAAPLMRELLARPELFEPILIHTGQHYDASMSDVFFKDLGMAKPEINLGCSGGDHAQTVAMVMRRISTVFADLHVDHVVVFGDVSSTLGAALAAAKLGIRIIHVEAGLRSHDPRMPEELNRVLTDHLSDMLLVSEPIAIENLTHEGIPASRIHHVGNIMIDSLVTNLPNIDAVNTVASHGLTPGTYVLATIHRQETVDDRTLLERVFRALQAVAKTRHVILPLHPRTKKRLTGLGREDLLEGLHVIEPLGYLEFTGLLKNAYAVVTDSGGVQEESSWLDIPCITLRDSTERPITVTHGTNTMIAVTNENVSDLVIAALTKPKHITQPIPLWDGRTAQRIADILSDINE